MELRTLQILTSNFYRSCDTSLAAQGAIMHSTEPFVLVKQATNHSTSPAAQGAIMHSAEPFVLVKPATNHSTSPEWQCRRDQTERLLHSKNGEKPCPTHALKLPVRGNLLSTAPRVHMCSCLPKTGSLALLWSSPLSYRAKSRSRFTSVRLWKVKLVTWISSHGNVVNKTLTPFLLFRAFIGRNANFITFLCNLSEVEVLLEFQICKNFKTSTTHHGRMELLKCSWMDK